MPTGGHWMLRIYDDVITEKVARNPEIVAKSIEQWELSINLGTRGGVERYIGTRYSYNDAYTVMIKRKAAIARIYPATDDGTEEGNPVYLTPEELADKRRKMGLYTFNSQMLQNPYTDKTQGFQRQWLRFYEDRMSGAGMNKVLIVDPANEKKKKSDFTTMVVWGLGRDRNFYVLDFIRDKLNLKERTETLFRMHEKWKPYGTYYEKYGKDADIEHIKLEQTDINYRFDINEVGGAMAKNDRIKRLIPHFEDNRIYLPRQIMRKQWDGKVVDIIEELLNDEYDLFPLLSHDDGLDVLSRLYDVKLKWPKLVEEQPDRERYAKKANRGWMGRL
jgi:predicted phage terminase large subunit-like protein